MQLPHARLVVATAIAVGILLPTLTRARDGVVNPGPAPVPGKIDYFKQVRPLLAQHCYKCHGPDEEKRKAGLRLDLPASAFAAVEGGAIPIVKGDVAKSELARRVASTDAEQRMPPPAAADDLKPEQVKLLQDWIAQGADWPEHWAFLKPQRPALPTTSDPAWGKTPIDAFIRAQLDAAGLKPQPEADKEALLRRASFDLTGLPPTPAELDAFLADKSPDAYEKQVDRLLASPRYGETWASWWLDLARYADTNGYQFDVARTMWKYRDWVVDALNANEPFDDFTTDQIAGDLIPNATLQQKVATGFCRAHTINSEAGEEEDEYRTEYVIDRVNTLSTVWMGLTLGCTQCHDHKFDPFSQKEYYRLFAFFNNVKERDSLGNGRNAKPTLLVPDAEQQKKLDELEGQIKALETQLTSDDAEMDADEHAWNAETLQRIGAPIEWKPIEWTSMSSRNGTKLERLADGSVTATGPNPVKDIVEFVTQPGVTQITGVRIEVWPHESCKDGMSGRAYDGRFILSEFEVELSGISDSGDPVKVDFQKADADVNQKRDPDSDDFKYDPQPASNAIDGAAEGGRGAGGWSLAGDAKAQVHEAIFLPREPVKTNSFSVLRYVLREVSEYPYKATLAHFRISTTTDPRVQERYVPLKPSKWSSVGPFAAKTAADAYATAFAPERKVAQVDLKKSFDKIVLPPDPSDEKSAKGEKGGKDGPGKPAAKADGKAPEQGDKPADAEKPGDKKPGEKKADDKKPDDKKPDDKKPDDKKPEKADKPEKKEGDGKIDLADLDPELLKELPPGIDLEDLPPSVLESLKNKGKKKDDNKLAWTEQPKWRDGDPLRPESKGAGATYLYRVVKADKDRTLLIRYQGEGFKLWWNGEPALSVEPKPEVDAKDEKKKDGDGFDFFRGRNREMKRLRVQAKAGENQLVVKMVSPKDPKKARSASLTLEIAPEGRDVLNHEVAQAVVAESREQAAAVPTITAAPQDHHEEPVAAPASPAPAKGGPLAADADGAPADLGAKAAATSAKPKPTTAELRRKVVREYFRRNASEKGKPLYEKLDDLKAELEKFKKDVPETMVLGERDEPRKTYVLRRGLYNQKQDEVFADTPSILPPFPKDAPRNRLGLAQWLMSPEHPLTSRVIVNRVWQQFFGIGIVRTSEDFGVRSDAPTHKDLLDWLAVEFMEKGWNLKALQRLIVTSAAYRQSAVTSRDALEKDDENRLLSRGPRIRLNAEMVRDNALYVSGLLSEQMHGESVKPYQPAGLWKQVSEGQDYQQDHDAKQYKRGLYIYWKRGMPYPSLLTFDMPLREHCASSRAITNTPLQALVLLNDPVYVEAARAFAQRMILEGGADVEARIRYGFRWCTSRQPTEPELALLKQLFEDEKALYDKDPEAAKKLLAVGDFKHPDEIDAVRLAAWTLVANALLNMDATIHKG